MVRLLEVEVKNLLKNLDLPIPKQFKLEDLNNPSIYPMVIKSQVPIGGRGKLGGIKFARNPEEARAIIPELNSLAIKGYLPKTLLLEEKLSILKEYYCGFLINRNEKLINFIFSEAGGIGIEQVSKESKEKIIIHQFTTFSKNLNELSEELIKDIDLQENIKNQLKSLIVNFLKFIRSYDAELFEINPLIETLNHELIIADARMNIDDNALFRHQEFKKNLEYYLNPLELRARKLNMSYVELDGNIGVICNGAGLVMGTIDTVQSYGKMAANFLDVGGGADAERMYQALNIITSNERVQVILINIIGGITRCDEIAKGLIKFLNENKSFKFSLRLIGTNEREGQDLLKPYNITIHRELDDAIQSLMKFLE
ncbi:MAG: succinate--CoA ligase subunit beta [Candidatus Helarchaeota archaeon]|nr:succinate--CoA ligase subunit beta [Candidatus Helarchaeota archaeon]